MALKNVIDGDFAWATRYATISVVLFRFELVLLFGPLYVILFLGRQACILSTLKNGILTAIVTLGMLINFVFGYSLFSCNCPNRFFAVEPLGLARR
jgi:hypothetical protein